VVVFSNPQINVSTLTYVDSGLRLGSDSSSFEVRHTYTSGSAYLIDAIGTLATCANYSEYNASNAVCVELDPSIIPTIQASISSDTVYAGSSLSFLRNSSGQLVEIAPFVTRIHLDYTGKLFVSQCVA
jgi:hypothetical protein